MHPAFSVIFFTVFSGIGYGLLALMGSFAALGILPITKGLGVFGRGLGFVAVSAGLLSSTVHLGHPERAWRAFSRWRSSWLSREGGFSMVADGGAATVAALLGTLALTRGLLIERWLFFAEAKHVVTLYYRPEAA